MTDADIPIPHTATPSTNPTTGSITYRVATLADAINITDYIGDNTYVTITDPAEQQKALAAIRQHRKANQ